MLSKKDLETINTMIMRAQETMLETFRSELRSELKGLKSPIATGSASSKSKTTKESSTKKKTTKAPAPKEQKPKRPDRPGSVAIDGYEPKRDKDGQYNWSSWKACRRQWVEDTTGRILHGPKGQWMEQAEFKKASARFEQKFPYVKKADR